MIKSQPKEEIDGPDSPYSFRIKLHNADNKTFSPLNKYRRDEFFESRESLHGIEDAEYKHRRVKLPGVSVKQESSSSMSFDSSSNRDDSSSSSDAQVYFKDDMENFEQFKQKLRIKRNKTTHIEETKKFSPFKDLSNGIYSNVKEKSNELKNDNIDEESPQILKLPSIRRNANGSSSPHKS